MFIGHQEQILMFPQSERKEGDGQYSSEVFQNYYYFVLYFLSLHDLQ